MVKKKIVLFWEYSAYTYRKNATGALLEKYTYLYRYKRGKNSNFPHIKENEIGFLRGFFFFFIKNIYENTVFAKYVTVYTFSYETLYYVVVWQTLNFLFL